MNKYYITLLKEPVDLNKGSITYYQPNLIVDAAISASRPGIEVIFDRFKRKRFSKPASNKFHFVKPVLKTEYEKCLKRNLEFINKPDWEEAEYYSYTFSDILELGMFTLNTKDKFHINIRLCNDYDYGSVEVKRDFSFSRRPEFRSRGKAIDENQFRSILKLICAYIIDETAYETNLSSLGAKVKFLLNDELIAPEVVNANCQDYLQQLEQRMAHIRARLIDNDSDTPTERASLRGELAGIEYAMKLYSIQSLIN